MKKKILVVDDNISIVNMIKEYFASSKEVEVIDEAYDGISAWEKIEKHKDCAAGEKPAVQSFVVTVQGFHGEISPFFHPERRAARGRTSRRPSRPFS